MARTLNWGILGTGNIARKFASQLPFSRTGRLVAVGSRSEQTAAAFAAEFPAARPHGSYESLLGDPEVEAVYLSMLHPWHAQWAIAAARAGKHILCEKPLAMNAREAEAIFAAAEEAGVFCMEAFMYRCHPRTHRMVEVVREGRLGEVRLITASFSMAPEYRAESRLFNRALGGGSILDVGCYTMSVARLLAGAAAGRPFADPEKLSGSATLAADGADLVAAATLAFPGGLLAQISCGLAVLGDNSARIYGTEGWMHVPRFWQVAGPFEIHRPDGGKEIVATDENPHLYAVEADVVGEALPARESQAMSWEDSLGNMRALDQWRKLAGVSYDSDSQD